MNNLIPSSNTGLMSAGEFQAALEEALSVSVKTRPYTARITRKTPFAVIFLLDQSGSMEGEMEFMGKQMTKADAVALIVNQLINTLLDACMEGGGARDYFDLAVIGYGQDDHKAAVVWEGSLQGRTFVKPSDLFDNFLEIEEIEVEAETWGEPTIEKQVFKKWITPVSEGLTPMMDAMSLAAELLEQWLVQYARVDVFPPIVINVTDGDATDGKGAQLLNAAKRIKDLHTSDGHVLFLNVHLSDAGGESVIFPNDPNILPDAPFAKLLYDMSSELPPLFNPEIAALTGKDSNGYYTGLAYNTNLDKLVRFLQIGTITPLKNNAAREI
jgi:uncharacterized protein YegL